MRSVGSSGRSVHILLLAAAAALVFSNSLRNEPHLDSVYRVRDNPEIERFWPPWRHFFDPQTSSALSSIVVYRPLLPLSLTIDRALADRVGLDRIAAFHVGNIAIHVLVCWSLYLLFSELLEHWGRRFPPPRARGLALAAALLFAVHPVAGSAVNYLSARDLLLMMLFLTLALLVYVRMQRVGPSLWGWALCLALLALSLFSKQNSVVAPLLVLSFGIVVARSEAWVSRSMMVAGAVAGYFAYAWLAAGVGPGWSGGALSRWTYACTMLRAHVAYYLRNFFWPFEMRALPAFEPASGLLEAGVLAGLAVVVASLALAAALWRRQPVASFAILAYWTLFLPTSSVQPFRFLVLDYRQYPSLAFACFLAALALGHLPRPASVALIGAFAVYFGASTYGISTTWRTEESFWEQSVRHGTLPMGHVAYARAVEERAPDLAEKHYRVALQAEPRNVYALFNLAFLYIRLDRGEEGLRLARRAVESAPDWAFSHFWLARAYRDLGRSAEAVASSREAADRDPKNVEYQYEAALDMQELGHYAESLRYLQRVSDRRPGYRHSVHAEGRALHELGRWTDAEQRYRDSVRRHPTYGPGWLDLGRGLGEQDRCPEAIKALEEALRLGVEEPATAHRWLARCYATGGDAEAAARHAAAAHDDPENR